LGDKEKVGNKKKIKKNLINLKLDFFKKIKQRNKER
jgi:hypothetical protein